MRKATADEIKELCEHIPSFKPEHGMVLFNPSTAHFYMIAFGAGDGCVLVCHFERTLSHKTFVKDWFFEKGE